MEATGADEKTQKIPKLPKSVSDAIYRESVEMPADAEVVKGYDFNEGLNYEKLLASMKYTGFQALHFGKAVDEIKRMIHCRELPLEDVDPDIDERWRPRNNCTIYLGYTSNMVSAGVRETIKFLVQHKMVDVLVSTAGGIEEDFIKCMGKMYLGDFKLKGAALREQGLNRTGNLIVPNKNYCLFEDWFHPILDQLLKEQNEEGINWTPSKIIARLGKEIDNEESIYYWAYKNNIPVFSPAITDGAIGDDFFVHSLKNPGLRCDIHEDICKLHQISINSKNTGLVIIGGGLIKHHICNSNLMRNGADFSVYINTANEFDGSDAGASPDEAISWGKIKTTAKPVKIVADATLVFPLLAAETFVKHHYNKQTKIENGN